MEGESCSTGVHRLEESSPEKSYQFHGRWYVEQILETDPEARDLFERLPGVFWFDQLRNLATPPAPIGENGEEESPGRVSYESGVARLRQHLNHWLLGRLAREPSHRDFLGELEK